MTNFAKETRRILHDVISPLTVIRWFVQKRQDFCTDMHNIDKLIANIGELRNFIKENDPKAIELTSFLKVNTENFIDELSKNLGKYRDQNEEAKNESGRIEIVEQAMNKVLLLSSALGSDHKAERKRKMSDIVRSAVKEARPYARRMGVKLKVRINRSDADADCETINRVLVNLINNAIEASGTKRVLVRLMNETGFTRIETLDDGEGICREHSHRVFDDGFTHGKELGSGTGLSFCKDEIEKLGGSIALHSNSGTGTIFAVNLPKDTAELSPDDSISE